jgi:RimJ/RimL family protein N-acetyltransferase
MLENYPKEIMTKDGIPILIRPATKADETALNAFFACIPPDEHWFLREDVGDPLIMRQWIEQLDYNRVIPLIAETEGGTIIANVRLHRRPAECLSHIAHLRIVVDPRFRNQRLGTWMLIDVIRLAMDMGIEKLVAEFVTGVEEPGIRAAFRLDFFEQAVLRDYVKDRNGNYRDLAIMVKTLHRDWSDF